MNADFSSRFDFSELLALEKCDVKTSSQLGLENDNVVELSWNISAGAEREAVEWVRSNRVVMRDFSTPFNNFDGVWRLVSVKTENQGSKDRDGIYRCKLVMSIAKGYYTSIDWNIARLYSKTRSHGNLDSADGIADTISDNPAESYTIAFPYCSPEHTSAMVSSLMSSTTITDPIVRGETLSGTWDVIVATSKVEEDKSRTIILVISNDTYTLKGYDRLGTPRAKELIYVWSVPKQFASAIMAAWRVAHPVGGGATSSFGKESATVDLLLSIKGFTNFSMLDVTGQWNCRAKIVFEYHWGLTREEADAYQLTKPPIGETWKIDKSNNFDGTFDVVITKIIVQYRRVEVGIVENDADHFTEEVQQLGLTTQDLESMTEELGIAKRQNVEIMDDCSKDSKTLKERGKPTESIKVTALAEFTEISTEKTYQDSRLPAPVAEQFKIHTNESRQSKYPGKFDTIKTDRSFNNQVGRTVEDSAGMLAVIELDTAKPAIPDDPTSSEGVTVRTQSDPQQHGGIQVKKSTQTSKPLETGEKIVSDNDEYIDREKRGSNIRSSSIADYSPQKVVGEVQESSFEKQDDGTFKAAKRRRIINNQRSVDYVISPARSIDVDKNTSSDEVSRPQEEKGKVKRVRQRKTREGRFASEVEVESPKNQTALNKRESASEVVTEEIDTEKDVQQSASFVQGQSIEVVNDPTEAGNFRARKRVAIPKDQTGRATIDSAERSIVEVDHTQEPSAPSDASAAVGQEVEVIDRPTEVGNHATSRRVTTYKPREAQSISGGPLVIETSIVKENQASPISDGPSTAGENSSSLAEPTVAGLYRSRKSIRTAVPFESNESEVGGNAFYRELLTIRRNKSSHSLPRVDGEERSQDAGVNEFALFDSSSRRRVPVKQQYSFISMSDETSQTTREHYHNADSIPSASSTTSKEVIAGDMNGLGKFDYIREVSSIRSDVLSSVTSYVTWGMAQWRSNQYSNFVEWSGYYSTQGAAQAQEHDAWTYGLGSRLRSLQLFREKATHTIRYFATEAEAASFVNSAEPSQRVSVSGSYDNISSGLYRAHRVVVEEVVINEIGV